MTNRYGITLDPASVRWAIAEGMPMTVTAAVLLLHERSVDDVPGGFSKTMYVQATWWASGCTLTRA